MRAVIHIFMFLGASWAGATSICTGNVRFPSEFAMGMQQRQITVTFSPSLDHCEHLLSTLGNAEALVVIEIGGDPLEYDGSIHLDGIQEHAINDPNGDVTKFWLHWTGGQDLVFSMTAYARTPDQPILTIEPSHLQCR